MAAATENTLSKVDSLVDDPSAKKSHRRASSMAADVFNIADLGMSPNDALTTVSEGQVGLTR
jgi:hypothetical protein